MQADEPATPIKLPRRLAVIVYDSLLLTGVLLAATALALGVTVLALGGESVRAHNPLQGNPFFQLYLLVIGFLFYGGFWTHGGQTLGMRTWRVRVRRRDGQAISWRQALLRFLTAGLWLIPVALLSQTFKLGITLSLSIGLACGLLLLALRLPDRISATELVLLPKA